MRIAPLRHVECVLLHPQSAPVDDQRLYDFVEAMVKAAGYQGECTRLPTDTGHVHVFAGNHYVLVSQNDLPLDAKGFSGCIDLPITAMTMPDARDIVGKHRANTFITIGKGTPGGADEPHHNGGLLGGGDEFVRWSEAETAMRTAYSIGRFVDEHNPASAVHWLPSDHLVTPEFFRAASDGDSMVPLYIRPYLYSSANRLGPDLPVGMVANGSQYILGRPVVFTEANVDVAWMTRKAAEFIDLCVSRGSPLGDGETFGSSPTEVIEVRHREPDAEAPLGKIELVVRAAHKFGIGTKDMPAISKHRETVAEDDAGSETRRDLDPDDPIDMAILVALSKQEGEADNQQVLPQIGDRRVSMRGGHAGNAALAGQRRATFGKRQ